MISSFRRFLTYRSLLKRRHCSSSSSSSSTQTFEASPEVRATKSCLKSLSSKIRLCGPITVADYMREVLLNPVSGYYTTKPVFGVKGDFITSPEISQLFGEMIAIWTLNEWQKLGSPAPLSLVELGPGRGTMMQDILRVYKKLGICNLSLSVHLVEMSDQMAEIQASNLSVKSIAVADAESLYFKEGRYDDTSVPIYWHRSIDTLPKRFSCILAHEFFDVLPVHKFVKTEDGWREILIDIDSEDKLRFVKSRAATPVSATFIKKDDTREHVEISPQSVGIMDQLGTLLWENGGFALVADYGHFGDKEDTFRAFRDHKLHDPLVEPGSADLTADVDFSFLKEVSASKLISFGPITQKEFLSNLHIEVRLQVLLKNAKSEEEKNLILSGYNKIMEDMGQQFKFMSFFPLVLKDYLSKYPVAGFVK